MQLRSAPPWSWAQEVINPVKAAATAARAASATHSPDSSAQTKKTSTSSSSTEARPVKLRWRSMTTPTSFKGSTLSTFASCSGHSNPRAILHSSNRSLNSSRCNPTSLISSHSIRRRTVNSLIIRTIIRVSLAIRIWGIPSPCRIRVRSRVRVTIQGRRQMRWWVSHHRLARTILDSVHLSRRWDRILETSQSQAWSRVASQSGTTSQISTVQATTNVVSTTWWRRLPPWISKRITRTQIPAPRLRTRARRKSSLRLTTFLTSLWKTSEVTSHSSFRVGHLRTISRSESTRSTSHSLCKTWSNLNLGMVTSCIWGWESRDHCRTYIAERCSSLCTRSHKCLMRSWLTSSLYCHSPRFS